MTRAKPKMLRQGDVMLIPIASNPLLEHNLVNDGPRIREDGGVVLAFGEVTGHAHVVQGPNVALFMGRTNQSGIPWQTRPIEILTAKQRTRLVHEEHATLTVEPGIYEIRRQREYTQERTFRAVAD